MSTTGNSIDSGAFDTMVVHTPPSPTGTMVVRGEATSEVRDTAEKVNDLAKIKFEEDPEPIVAQVRGRRRRPNIRRLADGSFYEPPRHDAVPEGCVLITYDLALRQEQLDRQRIVHQQRVKNAEDASKRRSVSIDNGDLTCLKEMARELPESSTLKVESPAPSTDASPRSVGSAPSVEMKDVVVPYIGERISLKEWPCYKNREDVQQILRAYDQYFDFRSIKGDGHCMFRSFAAALLFRLKSRPEEREDLINRTAIYELPGKEEFFALIRSLNDRSVEDILMTQKDSDFIVKFLRELACHYNQNFAEPLFVDYYVRETFGTEELTPEQRENYFAAMIKMGKEVQCGGECEMTALKVVFDLSVVLLDAIPTCQSKMHLLTLNRVEGKPEIYLFKTTGHYDLLLLKEGKERPDPLLLDVPPPPGRRAIESKPKTDPVAISTPPPAPSPKPQPAASSGQEAAPLIEKIAPPKKRKGWFSSIFSGIKKILKFAAVDLPLAPFRFVRWVFVLLFKKKGNN